MYDVEKPRVSLANQVRQLKQRNNILRKRNLQNNAKASPTKLVQLQGQIRWDDVPWHSKLTDSDKDHRIFRKQFVKAKIKPREANRAIQTMRKLKWIPPISKVKQTKVKAVKQVKKVVKKKADKGEQRSERKRHENSRRKPPRKPH